MSPNSESYEHPLHQIARLIAPKATPPWLAAFLEWWAQGLVVDRMRDGIRPTRSELRGRLDALRDAVSLIQHELQDPSVRAFLEIDPLGRIKNTSTLGVTLSDLNRRVEYVLESPDLVQRDGRTVPGRNRALSPVDFSARTLCAARIIEMWIHFRGNEPGSRNENAAAAADAYWRGAGGKSRDIGNPLHGWRHHFELVKANADSAALGKLRAIWRRDLLQATERGGPPWFLGALNPVPKPPIHVHLG
jgi:hypothetical protein